MKRLIPTSQDAGKASHEAGKQNTNSLQDTTDYSCRMAKLSRFDRAKC